MDKRIPLFQCGYWLLDRWGAREGKVWVALGAVEVAAIVL